MKKSIFSEIFDFLPKSKRQAGTGLPIGLYPFYTSSGELTKFIDEYDYSGNSLIFGTGGNPSVHYQESKFSSSTDCLVATPKNKNEVNAKYCYLFLKSNMIILESGFKGAGLKHISKEYISNIIIPLHPFKDQIRIVDILSRTESFITKRKESIRLLDELVKSVFLDMFGDPVRNEKGWDTKQFNKLGKFISGGTPSKERNEYWSGDFPWVSPKDMKTNYIIDSQDHISDIVFKETSLKKVESDNILIVVRGMILAHSFPVAINLIPVSINQDMKAIRLSEDTNARYIMHCLMEMKRLLLNSVTTAGHGTKRFDSDIMDSIKVPIPPFQLQNKFASVVKKVEATKVKYRESLSELEALHGSLSQRAFRGEL